VTGLRTTELVQGRTSRWAIAWSFAAPAAAAALPLPRAQQPAAPAVVPPGGTYPLLRVAGAGSGVTTADGAQAAPTLQQQQQQQQALEQQRQGSKRPLRQPPPPPLSFMVCAPAAEGRRVLQALAALLGSVGGAAQVVLDAPRWKVSGVLGDTAGAAAGGDAAAAVAAASASAAGPPQKHARLSAGSRSSGTVRIELSVYQQRKGFQVVAAAAPAAAPAAGAGGSSGGSDAAAPPQPWQALPAAVAAVREDMALMWPVTDCTS
jgi:hypothetical protein